MFHGQTLSRGSSARVNVRHACGREVVTCGLWNELVAVLV